MKNSKSDNSSSDDENIPLAKKLKISESANTSKELVVYESDSEEDVPLAQIFKEINEKQQQLLKKSAKSKKVESGTVFKSKKIDYENERSKSKKTESVTEIKTNPPIKFIIEPKSKDKKKSTTSAKVSDNVTTASKPTKQQKSQTTILTTGTGPSNETSSSPGLNESCAESGSESDEEYKWWENPIWDDTVKWETLEHNGVYFPPEYQPHGIKMLYEGKEILLEPEGEEVASFFAALIETDYAKNPTFVKNYFEDFQATLLRSKSRYSSLIKDFNKCDFTPIFLHFENLKIIKKSMTKEEKAKIKDEKKILDEEFGFCVLDGRKEKVGNYRIEPPGLFRGRGQHPKAGKLKTRVRPEDITINIARGSKVPSPPVGGQWKEVVHNNTVTWLATWTENINGVPKYVQLGATSSLKGKSDYKKFETARRLKHHITSIRAKNAEELRSKEMAVRQRATALWLIDHLAIRAGNEKGDDEADTVGCCSLRLEHVQLNPTTSEVTFDFLGKDSIRYLNTVRVDPIIIKNLTIFMRAPKTSTDMIFDRLDTSMLNSYLSSLMPGLTAKVFRTYNASFTMQRELESSHQEMDLSVQEKILGYNRANREVAILCNHQRAIPKSHNQSMEKLNEKIMHLKYHRLLLKRKLNEDDAEESDLDEEDEKRILKEIEAIEIEKYKKKIEREEKQPDPNYKPPIPCPVNNKIVSPEALEKKLLALSTRIQAARHQATDREENKTTSLGTSKINYIDPRITAAWCKAHQVPIEKMFTKTLRDKFKWAMDVPKEWRF